MSWSCLLNSLGCFLRPIIALEDLIMTLYRHRQRRSGERINIDTRSSSSTTLIQHHHTRLSPTPITRSTAGLCASLLLPSYHPSTPFYNQSDTSWHRTHIYRKHIGGVLGHPGRMGQNTNLLLSFSFLSLGIALGWWIFMIGY